MNRLIEDMEMAKKKENFQKSNRKKVKINRVTAVSDVQSNRSDGGGKVTTNLT